MKVGGKYVYPKRDWRTRGPAVRSRCDCGNDATVLRGACKICDRCAALETVGYCWIVGARDHKTPENELQDRAVKRQRARLFAGRSPALICRS